MKESINDATAEIEKANEALAGTLPRAVSSSSTAHCSRSCSRRCRRFPRRLTTTRSGGSTNTSWASSRARKDRRRRVHTPASIREAHRGDPRAVSRARARSRVRVGHSHSAIPATQRVSAERRTPSPCAATHFPILTPSILSSSSPSSQSSRWCGSMPARTGSRGTVTVIVCSPERMRCIFR